jgi:hypothetical protein
MNPDSAPTGVRLRTRSRRDGVPTDRGIGVGERGVGVRGVATGVAMRSIEIGVGARGVGTRGADTGVAARGVGDLGIEIGV